MSEQVFIRKEQLKAFKEWLRRNGRTILKANKQSYEVLRWNSEHNPEKKVLYENKKGQLKPNQLGKFAIKNFLVEERKKIAKECGNYKIKHPQDKISAYEIQRKLHNALELGEFDVRGDIEIGRMTVDLVVFYQMKAVCIIVTRSWKQVYNSRIETAKKKYDAFNIPVLVCGHISQIDGVVDKVNTIININKKIEEK